MKLSKLLTMLLGFGFLNLNIVEGDGGSGEGQGNTGGEGDKGNEGDKGAGNEGDKSGEGEGDKGGAKPTDAEAKLLKEVMDKKTKLENTTKELAQVKEQLKKFEGIDPEAVRNLLQQQQDLENKKLEEKGEWERLKKRMAEEHTKQIEALQGQVSESQSALQKALAQINDLSVGNLFGQSTFIREKLTLPPTKARTLYAEHFEYQEGKVIGYDKPKGAADRTAFVDSMGNPLNFDDVMAKLVEQDPEKDFLLRATVKSGANSESTKPGRTTSKEAPKDSIDKIAEGLKGLNIIQ